MTAYTVTWTDRTGQHTEKRDTWHEAVGVQAAHQTHGAHLDILDPPITTCAHCHRVITQTVIPWRWDDIRGEDLCTVAGILRHEPPWGWA